VFLKPVVNYGRGKTWSPIIDEWEGVWLVPRLGCEKSAYMCNWEKAQREGEKYSIWNIILI
jgi:hypothetical protein